MRKIPSEEDEMQGKRLQRPTFFETVDEKLNLVKHREQVVRKLSGWLSHKEAQELREAVECFNRLDEEDWD